MYKSSLMKFKREVSREKWRWYEEGSERKGEGAGEIERGRESSCNCEDNVNQVRPQVTVYPV